MFKWFYIITAFVICFILWKIFLSSSDDSTQQNRVKVSSHKYDLMLRNLLQRNVNEISVKHLAQNPTQYILLDARSVEEYQVSHLANARWVGYDDFEISRVSELALDTPIIVYCSVGYRSEKVTIQLNQAGFSKVYNLYGGIFEWVNHQQPLVNMQGMVTNQVHAYNRVWGLWIDHGEKVYRL